MAIAERERIRGSGGGAPNGVQGQSPWSGGQGSKPPEGFRSKGQEIFAPLRLTQLLKVLKYFPNIA